MFRRVFDRTAYRSPSRCAAPPRPPSNTETSRQAGNASTMASKSWGADKKGTQPRSPIPQQCYNTPPASQLLLSTERVGTSAPATNTTQWYRSAISSTRLKTNHTPYLATVCSWSSVRHGKHAGAGVLQLEVLVLESGPVDRFSPCVWGTTSATSQGRRV